MRALYAISLCAFLLLNCNNKELNSETADIIGNFSTGKFKAATIDINKIANTIKDNTIIQQIIQKKTVDIGRAIFENNVNPQIVPFCIEYFANDIDLLIHKSVNKYVKAKNNKTIKDLIVDTTAKDIIFLDSSLNNYFKDIWGNPVFKNINMLSNMEDITANTINEIENDELFTDSLLISISALDPQYYVQKAYK